MISLGVGATKHKKCMVHRDVKAYMITPEVLYATQT